MLTPSWLAFVWLNSLATFAGIVPVFVSLSKCHMSTFVPASDSTFRLSVSILIHVFVSLWLGDLTTYLFTFSWYCTLIASKGIPLLPSGSAFRRITHASTTTIWVLSVPLFRYCLSLCFAICFGCLGSPFYSLTKGLMLVS